MDNTVPLSARQRLSWKELVEAAIFETDPTNLSQCIQDAQDAIMDEIEDCFQAASQTERQALKNAMHAMNELKRVYGNRDGSIVKRRPVIFAKLPELDGSALPSAVNVA